MSDRLGYTELFAILGEEAFAALAEKFGGRRLYVPMKLADDHPITVAIGREASTRLSDRISPDTFKVPLARELLARHYRAAGLSNGDIASRLRITETAVEKIFRRMDKPPVKGSAARKPLPLFEDL